MRWCNKLYALTANEGDGTVSVVLVPGITTAAGAEAVTAETGEETAIESLPDFVADDLAPEVSEAIDETNAVHLLYLPVAKH